MARQHADQFAQAQWEDIGHNTWVLEFRMVKLEVYWDGNSNSAYRYEIHGFRKMRSKSSYASKELAQLCALRKLNDLMNVEATRIKDALTTFIPF